MKITIQRRDRSLGLTFWCEAKSKTNLEYQDSIETKCGGFINLPLGISNKEPVTCPDCLAGRHFEE